jgi:protein gp37
MAGLTLISWAHLVWNYWSGCRHVSPGCAHCYAEAQAERFAGGVAFPNGFEFTLRPKVREWPLTISAETTARKFGGRARIFVNSMSDVFLEDVPEVHVHELFDVMRRAHWHDFLILTKREERMLELAPRLPWPDNVWAGVSIENRRFVHRADSLRQVPAAIRFISAEPLLGPLEALSLEGIDWLIVGGESGRKARLMQLGWAEGLVQQCRRDGVAPYVKQVGAVQARALQSKNAKGEDPADWPESLRIREFPKRRAA